MPALATTPDPGKTRSLQRVTSHDGVFLICALDHLSDFAELLAPDPSTVTYEQTCHAKLELISGLAPSVSAFLLDPLFALGPALAPGALPGSVGLMASIETEGYHGMPGAKDGVPGGLERTKDQAHRRRRVQAADSVGEVGGCVHGRVGAAVWCGRLKAVVYGRDRAAAHGRSRDPGGDGGVGPEGASAGYG
jgi:hypothetical protein